MTTRSTGLAQTDAKLKGTLVRPSAAPMGGKRSVGRDELALIADYGRFPRPCSERFREKWPPIYIPSIAVVVSMRFSLPYKE